MSQQTEDKAGNLPNPAEMALTLLAVYFRWKGTLFEKRWLLWIFVFAVLGAYAANQAGWISAEVGRQPFVVYPEVKKGVDGQYTMTGGMRTVDGISSRNVVVADQVLLSIILFSIVYAMLFAVWVFVLNTKIQHGPDEPKIPPVSSGGLLDAAGALIDRHGRTLSSPVRDGAERGEA